MPEMPIPDTHPDQIKAASDELVAATTEYQSATQVYTQKQGDLNNASAARDTALQRLQTARNKFNMLLNGGQAVGTGQATVYTNTTTPDGKQPATGAAVSTPVAASHVKLTMLAVFVLGIVTAVVGPRVHLTFPTLHWPSVPAVVSPEAKLSPLSRQFYQTVVDHLPAYKTRTAELHAVAANYAKASKAIRDAQAVPDPSVWKAPDKIEDQLAALNRAALSDLDTWRPAFSGFDAVMNQLDGQGKLASAEDYAAVYDAVAQALNAF